MSYENINVPFYGWHIIRELGRGSYGRVYEISRKVLDIEEHGAMKVIPVPSNPDEIKEYLMDGFDRETIKKRFENHRSVVLREYAMMVKLKDSQNIVRCDDISVVMRPDGISSDIYIRMELLAPMREYEKLRGYNESEIIKVGQDICCLLSLCEARGIVHRDIKPANIMVSNKGQYKLGDFGIARSMDHTTTATRIGTLNYMAPEVYLGKKYGHSSDIYSLGLVLYWLMNDRCMPFLSKQSSGKGLAEELSAQNRRMGGESLPAPLHGSPKLIQAVLKALSYNPADRYKTAEDFNRALGACTYATDPNEETVLLEPESERKNPIEQAGHNTSAAKAKHGSSNRDEYALKGISEDIKRKIRESGCRLIHPEIPLRKGSNYVGLEIYPIKGGGGQFFFRWTNHWKNGTGFEIPSAYLSVNTLKTIRELSSSLCTNPGNIETRILVASVPANFSGEDCRLLRSIADRAGFTYVQIDTAGVAQVLGEYMDSFLEADEKILSIVERQNTLTASMTECSDEIAEVLACDFVQYKSRGGAADRRKSVEKVTWNLMQESGLNFQDIGAVVYSEETHRDEKENEGLRKILTKLLAGKRLINAGEEAVSRGMALQGAKLTGDPYMEHYLLLAVNMHTYWITERNIEADTCIIDKNTTIPYRKYIQISTEHCDQGRVYFSLYEGSSKRMKENRLIGDYYIDWVPTRSSEKKLLILCADMAFADSIPELSAGEVSASVAEAYFNDSFDRTIWDKFSKEFEAGRKLILNSLHGMPGVQRRKPAQEQPIPDLQHPTPHKPLEEILKKAEEYRAAEDYQNELNMLMTGLSTNPQNAYLLNLIGRANRRLGNFDAALEYYYRSAAINPDDLTIRTNIANAISMKGDHAHAKSIYETEIQRLEALNTPDARGVLAITYSSYALCIGKMGDLNGSREYLKKAEKVGYKNSSGIWKQLQHRT